MSPVDAVLFDYGMVLSAPRDPAVWSEMARHCRMTEPQLEQTYWLRRDDYDAGLLAGEEFWQGIVPSSETFEREQQIYRLISLDTLLWGNLNQPMVDWVQRLHRAGIRTGILSNMGDRMAEGLTARHPWLQGFHTTVWSHALRTRKPDLAIYAAAAEGLAIPPARILFLDDKQENIDAAIRFGMQALLYRDHETFLREMQAMGHGVLLYPTRLSGVPR